MASKYPGTVKPIRVGVLGFDRVMSLDMVGPMDAFNAAPPINIGGKTHRAYEAVVIGLSDRTFTTESGLMVKPQATLESVTQLDTLIIPGGPGSRTPKVHEKLGPWLKANGHSFRRVVSICTGIYLLAPTGLLDGRRVTTHWKHAVDVAKRFPKLNVDHDALYLKSDQFYTSAGITSGIDLSLALIEEDYGAKAALEVARILVVYLKRAGGQRQYSEPLRLQAGSNDPFSGLLSWILANLDKNLSIETLAARTSLSKRHFTRAFKEAYGVSPADLVESLRLDQARELLSTPSSTVQGVASATGFSSADSFRRAFARQFGVSPSSYRAPFMTGSRP
jgi:transcriptional regulator GlxA family with amidase domain